MNFLGDIGAPAPGTYLPFSFPVPAGSNFVLVVTTRATDIGCDSYWIELFGLPCGPPELHILNGISPGDVRLYWSTAYPDWRLQAVDSLIGAGPYSFVDVAKIPDVVGGQFSLTNTAPGNQKIYRLRR